MKTMSLVGLSTAAVLAICMAAVPAGAQESTLKSRIDRQVAPMIEADEVVGLVVGVAKDGQANVFSYGEVEKDAGQTPSGNTIYEIGSVTKVFTGVLLADAARQEQVALDDPVQNYLPDDAEMPETDDEPIRLVHLATHTSGLPRLPDNMPAGDPMNPYADYTAELLYAFLQAHQPASPPGEWEYSNLGMGLLGHLLSRQSGATYEELVAQRICQPLDMNDTVITLNQEQQKRLAPPYNAAHEPDKNWDVNVVDGAGALRSTADDMLKFIEAQFNEGPQPLVRSCRAAREIHHQMPSGMAMALGWMRARDEITYLHGGGTGGYRSYLAVTPSHQVGVVVLANTATNSIDAVGEKLIQTAFGIDVAPYEPETRDEIEVDPAVLEQYTGYYRVAPTFGIEVTRDGGQLSIQATGQGKAPIFPATRTEFFLKVVPARITFVLRDDGTVEKLILHQGGRDIEFLREQPESDE